MPVFALNAPSRLSQWLQHTISPDVLNFWANKINPLWSTDQALAQIVSRQATAQGSSTLVLKLNHQASLPKPGQHLAVRAQIDGAWVERSYSPSAVLDQPRHIAITITHVSGGKMSQWLTQHAKIGDILQLGQPFGDFQQPQGSQPIVLLAAGSGITPMISLLRDWQQQPNARAVQLRYWVSYREQACFVAELLALQQRQPSFTFELYLTQQPPLHAYEKQGRINAAQFAEASTLTQLQVLACGSADFIRTARASLPSVSEWQIEAFSPPAHPIEANGQQVTITLQRQQRSLSMPVGQSILQALEAAGIAHPSGCRMGLCNTCACPKKSGTTEHLIYHEQRHDADVALRVCVSTAKTDLILDL